MSQAGLDYQMENPVGGHYKAVDGKLVEADEGDVTASWVNWGDTNANIAQFFSIPARAVAEARPDATATEDESYAGVVTVPVNKPAPAKADKPAKASK